MHLQSGPLFSQLCKITGVYQTKSINKQDICWIISWFELSKMRRNNQTINPTLLQHFLQLMDLLLTLHNHRLLPLCLSCLAKSIDPAERIPPKQKTKKSLVPCFPTKTWKHRSHIHVLGMSYFKSRLWKKNNKSPSIHIHLPAQFNLTSPWLQPGGLFLGPRKGFGQCNTHQTDAIHQTSTRHVFPAQTGCWWCFRNPKANHHDFEMY